MKSKTLPELPGTIRIRVDALLKEAGEHRRAGDMEGRERFALEAWDLIPEPKLGWDYYSNILPSNNLLFYRDTKQFKKAQQWLEITRESYGPGRDDVIEFYAATLWFTMGELDKAWEEFDRQYKAGKRRPFQGEDRQGRKRLSAD